MTLGGRVSVAAGAGESERQEERFAQVGGVLGRHEARLAELGEAVLRQAVALERLAAGVTQLGELAQGLASSVESVEAGLRGVSDAQERRDAEDGDVADRVGAKLDPLRVTAAELSYEISRQNSRYDELYAAVRQQESAIAFLAEGIDRLSRNTLLVQVVSALQRMGDRLDRLDRLAGSGNGRTSP